MGTQIQAKLVRSMIGKPGKQRRTLKALGFSRLNQVVSLPDNPQIRGMIAQVAHLVQVTEQGGAEHETP